MPADVARRSKTDTSVTKAAMHQRGTVTTGRASNTDVDAEERQALRSEGLDPDDRADIAAIDLVRWETLARCTGVTAPCPTSVRAPCPGHTKHTFLAELGAARLKAFEASAGPG